MADYIDSFVDTREKRSLLMRLLCWFGWMIVCALALYTASRLIMVNDYAGLFGLLDDERMSWFAISRMVLQAMSIAQGTWWDYLSAALSALSLWEWALLLLSLFFAYGSRRIWKYAAMTFVQLLYFLAVGVLFLLALRSSSLQEVIVVLRMIGMRSDWTTSGHEAVVRTQDAIEQGDGFDVFIIDWMIPDLNGLEVVRRIRRLIGSNTPIIILTAYDWADVEVEAKAAGVTAFCAKPLFMSELRRILAEPFLPAEAAEQTEKKADFAGKRLLVVEDNALNREIAVTMLEEGGFEVDTAENGKVAVDKVRESAPGYYDLVLMDIQMPIMDGYAAARAIRALPDAEKAGLPIVAMTANAFDEDRQNAEKAGMNGHLSKPFDMQQLLTMLREKLSP